MTEILYDFRIRKLFDDIVQKLVDFVPKSFDFGVQFIDSDINIVLCLHKLKGVHKIFNEVGIARIFDDELLQEGGLEKGVKLFAWIWFEAVDR